MEILAITDAKTGSTASIAPEIGFNCFRFQAVVGDEQVDVIDTLAGFLACDRPSRSGIHIQLPFPNRVRGGRYRWGGREYEIALPVAYNDRAGNAIHGFCVD